MYSSLSDNKENCNSLYEACEPKYVRGLYFRSPSCVIYCRRNWHFFLTIFSDIMVAVFFPPRLLAFISTFLINDSQVREHARKLLEKHIQKPFFDGRWVLIDILCYCSRCFKGAIVIYFTYLFLVLMPSVCYWLQEVLF